MTDINDWPGHPDADPDCECSLGDGLQADGETPCPCIDARKANIAAQTITPAPQPAGEAVPVDLSHGWLIHKAGRGWYRPNAKGYTGCIAEAGRYSHEDALDYSHPNGWDGPRDNITIKHESEATTTRSDLCASGQRVRAVLEGAVNWLDALLTLVQETSCDPDDPEAFDEVVMAAGMWLSSARAEIERLDRATRRAAAHDASPAVTDKEKEDDDRF